VVSKIRRRGIPDDLENRLAEIREPGAEMLLVSTLMALGAFDTTSTLLHMDFRPEGNSVVGQGFVTLVNWATHQQCVDAEVPLSAESRPAFTFRRDTLVVAQNLPSTRDSSTAVTTIPLYPLPACR
jgi:hypothetical protein